MNILLGCCCIMGESILNQKQSRNREYEIDLVDLLRTLLRHWWLLLTGAVVVGAAMLIYTRFFVTPLYQSSVSFYVNNGQRSEDKISNSDITASQSLVETYIVILKYGTTLDEVIYDANLSCSPSALSNKITCSAINDTEVFQVTVTDPSPETAARIAQSIARILPSKVADVIEGSTVRIVREPNVPSYPSSPNLRRNAALGAALGFALVVVYVILRFVFDDRIRDAARMLKETYPSYPVLATIPDLMGESKGYYYHSQAREG